MRKKLVSDGTGVVYTIRCIPSGRVYVGQTQTERLGLRWATHRYRLRHGTHHAIKLQRAWDKYGEEAFVFEVIETEVALPLLTSREQHSMDVLRSVQDGFNSAPIAGCTRGHKQSPETIAKRVVKLKVALTGRKLSEETKQKIRDARALQAPITPEGREKISAASRGKKTGPNPRKSRAKGTPVTPEMCLRISNTLRGRKIAPEVVERMREAQLRPDVIAKKSKPLSPEHRRKLSEAHKGIPNNQLGLKRSPEARQRMSDAAKNRKKREVA